MCSHCFSPFFFIGGDFRKSPPWTRFWQTSSDFEYSKVYCVWPMSYTCRDSFGFSLDEPTRMNQKEWTTFAYINRKTQKKSDNHTQCCFIISRAFVSITWKSCAMTTSLLSTEFTSPSFFLENRQITLRDRTTKMQYGVPIFQLSAGSKSRQNPLTN